MTNLEQINKFWLETINSFSHKLNNPLLFKDVYATTKVETFKDNKLYVLADDDFAKMQLDMEKNRLEELFTSLSNLNVQIIFVTKKDLKDLKTSWESSSNSTNDRVATPKNELETHGNQIEANLNLQNYVVGDFNKNSYMLLSQILNNDQSLFNPIYIYSHTGLGKTHLVSAFANEYTKRYRDKKLYYIDSANFTKEILDALAKGGSGHIEALKERYSKYDILILEDIQYLSDKSKTNEILFYIFNSMMKQHKVLILTADRSVNQLNGFDDRMLSRFASGITTKIKEPDEHSLKTIVEKYVSHKDIKLTDKAIHFLVNYFNTDIRKLIGILNKLIFFISVEDGSIVVDENSIMSILDIENVNLKSSKKTLMINPNSVINAVAKLYNLKVIDIVGNSRKKSHTIARHIVMYILRIEYGMSLKDIGSLMNNRDHTTVLNGVEKVKEQISKDTDLKAVITNIVKSL